MAFRFCSGCDAQQLVQALQDADWWGEIIGPHGSGKSTLLHSLYDALQAGGRRIHWYTLREGQRRLRITRRQRTHWSDQTQVIVDGYEQLSWLARRRLKRWCRRRHAGLLVTSHRHVGFPPVWQTEVHLEMAQQLVRGLLAEDCRLINDEDVARCFQRQAGNLRETLFELYDVYESRSRQRSTA